MILQNRSFQTHSDTRNIILKVKSSSTLHSPKEKPKILHNGLLIVVLVYIYNVQ